MALAQNEYVEFDILEVAQRCGVQILKPLRNGQWLARCPFCGDSANPKHGHLYLKPDTGEYKCHHAGCDAKGFTIGLYANLHGIDTKTAYKELLNFTGKVPDIVLNKNNVVRIVENPVAPLERRHEVYSAMLELLPLYPLHLEDLLRRGLPEDVIKRNGYKSYPAVSVLRIKVADQLAGQYDLEGVPGFCINEKSRKWDFAPYPDGYFIPIRNHLGQIQGCQFRVLPYDKIKHSGKYTWFSSIGRECGTKASQWLHLAIPPGTEIGKRVWLTEGALKADIASYFMRVPFVATPGNCSVENLVSVLKSLGIEEVVMAYDADQQINQNVKREVEKLDVGISSVGIQVVPAIWPVKIKDGRVIPKGIDDACLIRAKRSLSLSEEVFLSVTETKTRKLTVKASSEQGSVTVEETVTRKYEAKGPMASLPLMQKIMQKVKSLVN